MPLRPRTIAFGFTGLLTALVLTGCDASAPSSSSVGAETSGAANPMNERDRERSEAWDEAVRGLRFDADGVVVTERTPNGDAALAQAKMAEGEDHVRSNRRTRAVKAYAEAVRADPENPTTYLGLAGALITKGKTDLALACYRTAIRLDPKNVEARFGLASTLGMEARRREAIDAMTDVVRLDPTHGPALERLAIWSYYEGDYDAAWKHVHAARAAGYSLPPQFIARLTEAKRDPAPS